MKKLLPTTYYDSVICSCVSKYTTNKNFFYQLSGQRKVTLTQEEFAILKNMDDLEMYLFYRYLVYLIYLRIIPISKNHFKYMNTMLNKIEHKNKNLKQQEEKVKELVKKKK